MSDSYFLKKDKESQKSPVGLMNSKQNIVTTEDTVNELLPEPQVMSKSLQRFVGGMFENFVSEGSVCNNETGSEKPITVLRGTGAAQSLLLKGVLSLTDETDLHKSILVESVSDTGFQSLPLHSVAQFQNNLCQEMRLWVLLIPIDGVEMLLGMTWPVDRLKYVQCCVRNLLFIMRHKFIHSQVHTQLDCVCMLSGGHVLRKSPSCDLVTLQGKPV